MHGHVAYASPNALSAYHRMGHASDLVGLPLAVVTRGSCCDPFDAAEVADADRARRSRASQSLRMEVRGPAGRSMLVRALPLRPRGDPAGALVLVRDVTDLRRRDMALLSKDATIREIHHRVKNNLQTVAALLRLQARRTAIPEAGRALEESVRRVNSIALVHEALSGSVAETRRPGRAGGHACCRRSATGRRPRSRAKVRREGGFGTLPAALATPLVLVLTELVHNALAHAFEPGQTGEVVRLARAVGGRLDVVVADDGTGMPAGFDLETADGLGLQIVRTLLGSELEASLRMRGRGPVAGRRPSIRMPLGGARTAAARLLPWPMSPVPRSRRHRCASTTFRRLDAPPTVQAGRAISRNTNRGPAAGGVRLRARGGGAFGFVARLVSPVRLSRSGGASAGTSVAALQRTPLVLAHAAPHAGVLAALESPGQALARSRGSDGRRSSPRRSAAGQGRSSPRGRTAPGPRRGRSRGDANPWCSAPRNARSGSRRSSRTRCFRRL